MACSGHWSGKETLLPGRIEQVSASAADAMALESEKGHQSRLLSPFPRLAKVVAIDTLLSASLQVVRSHSSSSSGVSFEIGIQPDLGDRGNIGIPLVTVGLGKPMEAETVC